MKTGRKAKAINRGITKGKTNGPTPRESRCRAFYEHGLDASFLSRPEDGAIVAANPAACNLSGYLEHELTSLHLEQLLEMTDPRLAAPWTQCAEGVGTAEVTFICKDGTRIEAWISSKMFLDERGQQLACTTIRDISVFRFLYENAPVGIACIDHEGYLIQANRKFAEMAGYPLEDIVGMSYGDVMPSEDRARGLGMELKEEMLSENIDTIHRERRILRKDGSTIWVRVTGRTTMRDKLGKVQQGMAIFEDITERKRAEDASLWSEEKFRATFEHAPLGIAECTVAGRFVVANSKLVEILGYTKDEIAHLTMTDVTHPADIERSLSNLQKLATGEANSCVMEKRYIRKDRSIVWVNVTASLTSIHGMGNHMIAAIEDITARKKAEEDLKQAIETSYHQASHDMLTGLANRAFFNDRLKEALAYAKRDGHMVAILLLDLDRFKSINDTLGHHIGDLLLKDVAKRIASHIRATDLAARLGGDEFVVIQTHLAEPGAAGILAGKLVEDLGGKYVLEDQEVHSGASLGIALYPNDAEDAEELMKHVDLALYNAKHRGRSNYQFYRKELGVALSEAQRSDQELARALHNREFFLHYQPQFGVKSGRITGVEALLRWNHPARGKLAAAEFIQKAERARLMPSIGEWIFEVACRQYKSWSESGLAAPLILNLSSMQLRDPRFLHTLTRILDETALPASMLQLEIRENAFWDPKCPKSLLEQMKESGFRIALDDFSAEMIALSTLDRFPLDAVKIGQRLMKELLSRKRDAFLAAIVHVAHDLEIAVCADGVETSNQLDAVKEQGCDFAQGNWLSSPLDPDAMTKRIETEMAH